MGLFITLEGIEGCGKTTQFNLLKAHFDDIGAGAVTVREPGGTSIGEKTRAVLLDSASGELDPRTELFLYEACRAQLVKEVLRPALEAGHTVLCDRFTDSTIAYQGWGRGLPVDAVKRLNALATGGITPDLTILLDCEPAAGLARAWSRINSTGGAREDRFEREDLEFHTRVRTGYLALASEEPGRIKVVDASDEIPTIHAIICDIIDESALRLGKPLEIRQ